MHIQLSVQKRYANKLVYVAKMVASGADHDRILDVTGSIKVCSYKADDMYSPDGVNDYNQSS